MIDCCRVMFWPYAMFKYLVRLWASEKEPIKETKIMISSELNLRQMTLGTGGVLPAGDWPELERSLFLTNQENNYKTVGLSQQNKLSLKSFVQLSFIFNSAFLRVRDKRVFHSSYSIRFRLRNWEYTHVCTIRSTLNRFTLDMNARKKKL